METLSEEAFWVTAFFSAAGLSEAVLLSVAGLSETVLLSEAVFLSAAGLSATDLFSEAAFLSGEICLSEEAFLSGETVFLFGVYSSLTDCLPLSEDDFLREASLILAFACSLKEGCLSVCIFCLFSFVEHIGQYSISATS